MTGIVAALQSSPVPQSLVGNSVAVGIIAILHIQIATFITGSTTIAVINEAIAMRRKDERHERIAHGLVKAMTYVFGFGSAVAIFFVIFILSGLWGQFFVALARITFWVFIFEAGTFVGEIVLLYGLYANWDRLRPYRSARLGLLILLNVVDWLQMFFINVVASYMLTPNGGDVSQIQQILNPTDLLLTLHRTFGNIAWAGAVIAFAGGVAYLWVTRPAAGRSEEAPALQLARSVGAMSATMHRPKAADQDLAGASVRARHWDYVGQWGAMFAIALTLFQPYVGYSYAKEIQLHAYPAWYEMMFGGLSNVFLAQITMLGLIFTLGALYFWRRMAASGVRVSVMYRLMFVLIVLATVVAAMPARFALTYSDVVTAHLDRPWWDGGLMNPIGTFIPNKVFAMVAMFVGGLFCLTAYLRAQSYNRIAWGQATRRSQVILLMLGVTVSLMMMIMGVIREHSRRPYLISGELTISHAQVLTNSRQQRAGQPSVNSGGP